MVDGLPLVPGCVLVTHHPNFVLYSEEDTVEIQCLKMGANIAKVVVMRKKKKRLKKQNVKSMHFF